MNISALFGFGFAATIVVGAVFASLTNPMSAVHGLALFIVLGGTLSVMFIAFSIKKVFRLMKTFFRRVFGKERIDYRSIIEDIVKLNEAKQSSKKEFEAALGQVKNRFLKEACATLFWRDAEVDSDYIRALLEGRSDHYCEMELKDAEIFRTLGKFPPAFGLMGTILGMIALLQGLGGAASQATIGPAMSIALVATLYGVVIANMFLFPVADNLKEHSNDNNEMRKMIIEGVMLIDSDLPSRFIRESLSAMVESHLHEVKRKAA